MDRTETTRLVEYLEISAEVLVEGQHRRHVAAAVAVVGGAPHRRDALAGEMVLESLHDELMEGKGGGGITTETFKGSRWSGR